MAQALPRIRIDGKEYFVDKRLSQIREVSNPHNFEYMTPEVIDYIIENNIKEF